MFSAEKRHQLKQTLKYLGYRDFLAACTVNSYVSKLCRTDADILAMRREKYLDHHDQELLDKYGVQDLISVFKEGLDKDYLDSLYLLENNRLKVESLPVGLVRDVIIGNLIKSKMPSEIRQKMISLLYKYHAKVTVVINDIINLFGTDMDSAMLLLSDTSSWTPETVAGLIIVVIVYLSESMAYNIVERLIRDKRVNFKSDNYGFLRVAIALKEERIIKLLIEKTLPRSVLDEPYQLCKWSKIDQEIYNYVHLFYRECRVSLSEDEQRRLEEWWRVEPYLVQFRYSQK